ncbi:MAG: glycoside hydrolase family 2 TIM barrel-domain containing protein, partial [Patescibacteria group bacterium]
MTHILRNIIIIFIACIVVIYALLWLFSIKKYSVEYGISFDKDHASYLGLDWKKTYLAVIDDLKPKYIRLSAKWDEIEKARGKFDATELDWQMNEAGKRGVKVALVVGQKTPRWPECHIPKWANQLTDNKYQIAVKEYVKYVVEKYKNHPALDIWQVENEPFIDFKFGECERFDERPVAQMVDLVRSLDNKHKIMLTDSGEMGIGFRASRLSDIFGTTVYRIVKTPGGYIWKYNWLPAGLYKTFSYSRALAAK